MIQDLNDTTFEDALRSAKKPMLVDFGAPWCGPCRMQRPVLQRIADAHPEIVVAEVDVDASPAVANAHRIQSLPTIVLFDGGEAVARARGLQTASKLEALLKALTTAA